MNKLKSCELATRLASDALDRRLSTFERLRLRLHLLMCRSCSNCSKEMALLKQTLEKLRNHEQFAHKHEQYSDASLSEKDRKAILDALHKAKSATR